jgi:hypothetical protein
VGSLQKKKEKKEKKKEEEEDLVSFNLMPLEQ